MRVFIASAIPQARRAGGGVRGYRRRYDMHDAIKRNSARPNTPVSHSKMKQRRQARGGARGSPCIFIASSGAPLGGKTHPPTSMSCGECQCLAQRWSVCNDLGGGLCFTASSGVTFSLSRWRRNTGDWRMDILRRPPHAASLQNWKCRL